MLLMLDASDVVGQAGEYVAIDVRPVSSTYARCAWPLFVAVVTVECDGCFLLSWRCMSGYRCFHGKRLSGAYA